MLTAFVLVAWEVVADGAVVAPLLPEGEEATVELASGVVTVASVVLASAMLVVASEAVPAAIVFSVLALVVISMLKSVVVEETTAEEAATVEPMEKSGVKLMIVVSASSIILSA
jgi:hypothetical protein